MQKVIFLAFALTFLAGYFAISNFSAPVSGTLGNGWERKAALESPRQMSQLATEPNTIQNWPPVVGKRFPQFDLFDHTGKPFKISSLRGKPTVIEFISMTCAGCQAFAGGKEFGPYGGLASQPNLESFETYFRQIAGFDLHSGKVNFVVAVAYNDKLRSPTSQDLSDWRNHFHMDKHENTFIVSSPELSSGVTFRMIPGFLLLDSNQDVLFDSTGHHPTHNLYTELLPAVPRLLSKKPPTTRRAGGLRK